MARRYVYFVHYAIWDRGGRPAGEGSGEVVMPEAITSMGHVKSAESWLEENMRSGHRAVIRNFHPLRIEG
ncbi:hypothetical protein [Frankia sp. R82]|uniref:hypothetical protein n=1 Tax=Frankia sp. R82 TaxID=2950553 RepID=UPI0020437744|nr:hypothetical protein [Frankia sp. R82]MCM3884167.1 hypothetical protein [Frankia sp. R82]